MLFLFLIFKKHIVQGLSQLFVIDKPSLKDQLSNSILLGLLIFGVYAIFFNFIDKIKIRRDILLTFLLILCLLDPIYHNRYINPTVDEAYFKPPQILQYVKPPTTIYRNKILPFTMGLGGIEKIKIMSFYRQTLFPFSGLPYGVKYEFNDNFMATYSTYQMKLYEKIDGLSLEDKLKILRYLGCEYYIGNQPMFFPEAARKIVVEGYTQYIEKISEEPAKPMVVFKAVQAAGLDQKLKIFINPEFDPQKEVVVDQSVKVPEKFIFNGVQAKAAGVEGDLITSNYSIEVLEEKSGFGRYRASLDKDGIVVIPFNWAKGWKAWVDGKKTAVFEANLFSKGLIVPAGEHEIMLKYWPDSFVIGSVLSLMSLGGILFSWTLFYFQRRTRKALFLNKEM